MSPCIFKGPSCFFTTAAAAAAGAAMPETPTPDSKAGGAVMFGCCSCPPLTAVLEFAVGHADDSTAADVFLRSVLSADAFVGSTFSAVVDSEMAPDLNFGFGFAWIPV